MATAAEEAPKGGGSKGTGKLKLAMWTAIILSVVGVPYALWTRTAADGGRGGALAVALTFFMLFMNRGTAERAFDKKTGNPEDDIVSTRNALGAMLDWNSKEKPYLAVSSVVGTLAWGFGDVVARLFGAC